VQVLRNADFLFESLFESSVTQLARPGGHETTRKVDLEAPLFPIRPCQAFANILRGTDINTDRNGGNFFTHFILTMMMQIRN